VRALLKAVNLPYMRVATESMDIVLQKNAN